MSEAAILSAVRDQLREQLALKPIECDVMFEPPASTGEEFIAIEGAAVSSSETESLKEVYQVYASVWKRTGKYPADRRGNILLDNVSGLDVLERRVIRAVHGNQMIRLAACELAKAPSEIGGDIFQKALYYQGREPTRTETTGANGSEITWMVRRLRFAGMTRVQSLESMR